MDTLLSADSTINFMDHHAVAAVSLTGISLDVLGGLYLAYDLLGGQHGPLRLLTRMVTYSIVFGLGYGLDLGLFFAATAGYYADNLPERRLGVFGVALVFCGFALQSYQYQLSILDIQVQ